MTNSNYDRFCQGSVWVAKVYFKNEGRFKNRPVVIVGNELTIDIDVLISPVTSSEKRTEFDVVIEYWKEAGLLNPSIARIAKLSAIPKNALLKKIGSLHVHDLERILFQCKRLF